MYDKRNAYISMDNDKIKSDNGEYSADRIRN